MASKKTSVVIHHFDVQIGDDTIRVPVDRNENRVASMVSASNLRDLINSQIKKWRDGEVSFTPKELKDLSDALAVLAKSSADIYNHGELDETPDRKEPESKEQPVDFNKIIEVKAEPQP